MNVVGHIVGCRLSQIQGASACQYVQNMYLLLALSKHVSDELCDQTLDGVPIACDNSASAAPEMRFERVGYQIESTSSTTSTETQIDMVVTADSQYVPVVARPTPTGLNGELSQINLRP